MNSRTNQDKETTQVNSQNSPKEENIQMTINANNLNFYSDKQWEEYDILTKLDGYELDYQDNLYGWIEVVKWEGVCETNEDFLSYSWQKVDIIHVHKDGRIEHV